MSSVLAVILMVIVVLLVVLALGGAAAVARRGGDAKADFESVVEDANRALASARAQDRGWEPATMREAAQGYLESQRPGAAVALLELVQVLDRPGTDEDKAVFRCGSESEPLLLTLGRRNGAWVGESVESG